MSDIKFGSGSIGQPAPKGWRQFERAFIMGFLPAIVIFIQTWGYSDALANKLMVGVTLLGSLVKSVGMFLSNGDTIVPQSTLTDEQKDLKK